MIRKEAVNSNLNLNDILSYLGAYLCIWKNTCYIWRKDTPSGSVAITKTAIVNSVGYNPYYDVLNSYDSLKYTINKGVDYTTGGQGIDSQQDFYSAYNTPITSGDDRLPCWKDSAFGNWNKSKTDNRWNIGTQEDNFAVDIYDSPYMAILNIFDISGS